MQRLCADGWRVAVAELGAAVDARVARALVDGGEMTDIRRYYVPAPDASHPMRGWYLIMSRTAMPIGPFPDQERVERAVEALQAAMGPVPQ